MAVLLHRTFRLSLEIPSMFGLTFLETWKIIHMKLIINSYRLYSFTPNFWSGLFHLWTLACPLLQTGYQSSNMTGKQCRSRWDSWSWLIFAILSGAIQQKVSVLVSRAKRVKILPKESKMWSFLGKLYTYRRRQFCHLFFLPSEKWSTLKRKEFAPIRSKFFPF